MLKVQSPSSIYYFGQGDLEADFEKDPETFKSAKTYLLEPSPVLKDFYDLDAEVDRELGGLYRKEPEVPVSEELPSPKRPPYLYSYSNPGAPPLVLSEREASVLERYSKVTKPGSKKEENPPLFVENDLSDDYVTIIEENPSFKGKIDDKDHPTNIKTSTIFGCFLVFCLGLLICLFAPALIGFAALGMFGAKIGAGMGLAGFSYEVFSTAKEGRSIYLDYFPQTFVSSNRPSQS